jgi:hypothetical protein
LPDDDAVRNGELQEKREEILAAIGARTGGANSAFEYHCSSTNRVAEHSE